MTPRGIAANGKGTSRRGFLAAAGGVGLAAALGGCGSDNAGPSDPGGAATTGGGGYQPPKYLPYGDITPEFPAGDGGIPAGYSKLPDPLSSMGNTPLPEVAPISALLQGSPPAVSFDNNDYYQAVAADAGTTLEITYGGYAEYLDKFQVMVASDDLPDVVMMTNVRRLPELLESQFTDLTEFLSGDKVAEYPGLASIPPECWKVPVLNNRLWGVSKARPAGEGIELQARGDILAERGIDPNLELTNGEDFLDLLAELTDPGTDHFALAQVPTDWLIRLISEMHGTPYGWRETDGSFIHQYETPEMAAAVEQMAKIWEAGYLHPESFSQPNAAQFLESGTIALLIDGIAGWAARTRAHPDWDIRGIAAPKWDGGGLATKHLSDAGYPAYAAIRKQDSPDRVREILRVMDYIASPFGTEEWLTVNFGVEGKTYSMTDGMPELTDGYDQQRFRHDYMGSQVDAQLFIPGDSETVERQHTFLKTVLPNGESDASNNLYSDAAMSKGQAANRVVKDLIGGIIQGRNSMSEWEAAVQRWKSSAGDAMRGEYEEAFAAAG